MRMFEATFLMAMAWAGMTGAACADVTPAKTTLPAVAPAATSTQYNSSRAFPNHNGPLSAILVVIPKAELSEFARPSGVSWHLDPVAKVQPGGDLALKLIFMGVKTDPDGMANVTYDLQMTGPDGKIYSDSDYKAVQAVKGKVINPNGLMHNRLQTILLTFTPKDQPGVYQIKAVLHDNVAARDVPVTASVELVPAPGSAFVSTPAAPASSPATPPITAAVPPVKEAVAPVSATPGATMAPIANPDDGKKATDDDLVKTVRNGHVYWHHKHHGTQSQ